MGAVDRRSYLSICDPSSKKSLVNLHDSPSIYLLDSKSVAELIGTNLFTIIFFMVSYIPKKVALQREGLQTLRC